MEATTTLTDALNDRPAEYRYLLLDPMKKVASWNPLHVAKLSEHQEGSIQQRVLRPDLAWSPEHCPILFLLAAPGAQCDEELVHSSEEYARDEALYEKRYVCGWLSSSLAPDAMAEWLASLCGNLKQGVSIPVFEPLRFELLLVTADLNLMAGQFAGVSQWHLMSCSGELKTLNGEHTDNTWVLNWGAEQAQNEARNLWRLLSVWHDASEALPEDAVRQAVDAWAVSGKVRLHHLSDRFYLALSALTQPADITKHAAVQSCLQQASDDAALYFEQLMQTLPDSVWQELRHA